MEELYRKFKDKDFTMLAINLREDGRKVKAFKEKFGLSFPIPLDSNGAVGSDYGIASIPTTYLIDREGYVIGIALGPRDWSSRQSFGLINHLLGTPPTS